MKATGKMIKHQVLEFIDIITVLYISENGKKISKKAEVLNIGLTNQNSWETII